MPFVHRALLLSVALILLLSTTVGSSVGRDRDRTYRKLDEELQLSKLLGFRNRHRTALQRHDNVEDTHWRPVFDSDLDGHLIKRNSRSDGGLTAEQQTQLVDEHNKHRRAEGASNMEKLKWSAKLEKLAAVWAEKCSFTHGIPMYNTDDVGFTSIGQNNWIGNVDAIDAATVVQSWADEKQHFDSNSGQCTSGDSCDRYKQLVWSSTTDVGCAVKLCDTVGGLSGAHFVVCYYGPSGNWENEEPFLSGQQPCTLCARGQFFCSDGLCDSTCSSPGGSCECKAECKNCGSSTSDCKCQCKDGSSGIDCALTCSDHDERCGRKEAGWPQVMCRPSFQFVVDACPLMCGTCKAGNPCGRYNSGYGNDKYNEIQESDNY